MKFYQLSLISAVLLAFSPLVYLNMSAANAQTSTNQRVAVNRYPKDVVDNYLKDCLGRSLNEGLSQQEAQSLCNCTINKFQARYDVEQFRRLMRESKTNRQAADTLSDVGYTCFEDMFL